MYLLVSMFICGVTRLASSHKNIQVLSTEQVQYLIDLHKRLPKKFFSRDYNLFNVYKTMIPRHLEAQDVKMLNSVATTIKNNFDNKKELTHYFLEYVKESFTNIHIDNPNRVNKTAVTLLSTSDDLIGGQVVLLQPITEQDLLEGKKQPSEMKANSFNVPIVIQQNVGSTLLYDNNVLHGVSKVEQGHRLVLISWFG